MAHARPEVAAQAAQGLRLPLTLEPPVSRKAAVFQLLLFLPAALALSVPLAWLLIEALAEPTTLAILAERPLAAIQTALGIAVWLGFFVLPTWWALARLMTRRRVEIAEGRVIIKDTTPFGERTWMAPLASFRGIAHHIRASMSGLAHEIVLVHPEAARSVTLVVKDRVTQAEIDHAKSLLGLGEVSPRALYERELRQGQHAAASGRLSPAGP